MKQRKKDILASYKQQPAAAETNAPDNASTAASESTGAANANSSNAGGNESSSNAGNHNGGNHSGGGFLGFLDALPGYFAKESTQLWLLAGMLWGLFAWLLPTGGHGYDLQCWARWTSHLLEHGVGRAYGSDTNYPPLYLYVLKLFGWVQGSNPEALLQGAGSTLKRFTLVFDIGCALLLARCIAPAGKQVLALLLILGNGALMYNTLAWGQMDAALGFFTLAAFIAGIKGRTLWAATFLLLAINTKPQAGIYLPVLLLCLLPGMLLRTNWRTALHSLTVLCALQIIILSPLIYTNGIYGMWERMTELVGKWPNLSLSAHNFWQLTVGGNLLEVPSTQTAWLGFTFRTWGMLLFFASSFITLLPLCAQGMESLRGQRVRPARGLTLLSAALVGLCFFYFNAEMHERYMHVPLLLAAGAAHCMRGRMATLAWISFAIGSAAYGLSLEGVLRHLQLSPSVYANAWVFSPLFIAILYTGVLFIWLGMLYARPEGARIFAFITSRAHAYTRPGNWVWPAVTLTAITFAVYLPALANNFINWDDPQVFLNNTQHFTFNWPGIRFALTSTSATHFMPLVWLTYAIDFRLFGLNPSVFHLTSVLWHCAVAVVLYTTLGSFLRLNNNWKPFVDTYAGQAIRLGAVLLFALHPLRVEAVDWAAARMLLVCAVFYLLAIKYYVEGQRRAWHVCTFAALCSMGYAIMLPVIFLVLDASILGRIKLTRTNIFKLQTWKPFLLEKKWILGGAVFVGLVSVYLKSLSAMDIAHEHHFIERIIQAPYGLIFYLVKTVWPANLQGIYLLKPGFNAFELKYIAAFIAALGITAALYLRRGKAPWALAAWVAYVIILFPVLGIFQSGPQLVADRYSYLPAALLSLLLAAGAFKVYAAYAATNTRPRILLYAGAGTVALLALLSTLTYTQHALWKNSQVFWDHMLAHDPAHYIALNNRAIDFYAVGDNKTALSYYNRAVEAHPHYASAIGNRGFLRSVMGDFEGAFEDYARALELRPNDAGTISNRGLNYVQLNMLEKARAQYESLLPQGGTVWRDAQLRLADIDAQQSKYEAAFARYAEVLTKHPVYPQALFQRGQLYAKQGELRMALSDFSVAINHPKKQSSENGPFTDPLKNAQLFLDRARVYERAQAPVNWMLKDLARAHNALPPGHPQRPALKRRVETLQAQATAAVQAQQNRPAAPTSKPLNAL